MIVRTCGEVGTIKVEAKKKNKKLQNQWLKTRTKKLEELWMT